MSGWFELKCKRFQTQKSAPKTRDDSVWLLVFVCEAVIFPELVEGIWREILHSWFQRSIYSWRFSQQVLSKPSQSILDKSSVIDDLYIRLSHQTLHWVRQFPSHVWFSYLSTIQESLTVTNRAVQLLVEKSGLADVPLRESLMLVWGRRFSCDVATGMIPLGDLLLGSPEFGWRNVGRYGKIWGKWVKTWWKILKDLKGTEHPSKSPWYHHFSRMVVNWGTHFWDPFGWKSGIQDFGRLAIGMWRFCAGYPYSHGHFPHFSTIFHGLSWGVKLVKSLKTHRG